MALQNYEEYWKLTNAFTNYNGRKFLDTLAVCLKFIDDYKAEIYSEDKYSRLQDEIYKVNPINHISIRKSINQLVKMGFINSFLVSYHSQAIEYVEAKTNKKRETLLSKIVYSNSSFNRAVNNESSIKQINFLIQTLIQKGKLSKEEINDSRIEFQIMNYGFFKSEQIGLYSMATASLYSLKSKVNES